MTGWTLRDQSNHVYKFGTFKLGPGKSVTVRNGKGTNTSTTRYWGSSYYIWNNSGGDSATLRTSTGTSGRQVLLVDGVVLQDLLIAAIQ